MRSVFQAQQTYASTSDGNQYFEKEPGGNDLLTSLLLLTKVPKTDFRFRRARPRVSFAVRGGLGGLVVEDSGIFGWLVQRPNFVRRIACG